MPLIDGFKPQVNTPGLHPEKIKMEEMGREEANREAMPQCADRLDTQRKQKVEDVSRPKVTFLFVQELAGLFARGRYYAGISRE